MIDLALSIDKPDWRTAIRALAVADEQKAALVLESVGTETIAFLRSLTAEMRPPAGARLNTTAAVEGGYFALEEGGFVRPQGPKRAIPARMTRGTGVPRQAHPGHWADISGQLALSYQWHVERFAGGARLVLENVAEYAVHLEAREGFFVLSGVTERGGPVEMALKSAVAHIAPDWTVVTEFNDFAADSGFAFG